MSVLPVGFGSAVAGGYQIQRSLRFNSADSAYLSRTFSTPTSNTVWSWSCWLKRSTLASTSFILGLSSDCGFGFTATDELRLWNNAGTTLVTSTAVFRDVAAWYHIVFISNGTTIKGYVNNAEYLSYTGTVTNINSAIVHNIGRDPTGTRFYVGGYMTEVYFVDGQALTPSSFGQINASTGVWEPIAYTGTYGTNGFYVNFSDNSNTTAATLGKDYSGNGNNWTPNSFSVTAGAGNDSMVDSPTSYGTDTGVGGEVRGNYATWNSLINGDSAANGNLDVTNDTARSTQVLLQFDTYWEITSTGGTTTAGTVSGTGTTNTTTIASTKTYGFRLTTAGTLDYKNITDGGSFTNITTGLTSQQFIYASAAAATTGSLNAGQRPFAATAPSGFKALVTTNLPMPTIGATSTTQANDYFNTVLYSGNGSTQSITGVGFQPDWVWVKSRSSSGTHSLTDAVRGVNKQLFTNLTNAEGSQTDQVTAFNSDGFSLGANVAGTGSVNVNTVTYVAWNWNAGGSNQTISVNQYGSTPSIASTVRANTTSRFSIATFTKNATNVSVGHGLGVTPTMIIVKGRGPSTSNWLVYHQNANATPQNGGLALEQTTGFASNIGYWNNTAPTLEVFTVGSFMPNENSVAYCFAEVPGYSAFGTYTGNNSSTDGTFVYLGFRPRFLMIKSTSGSTSWVMMDSSRNTYNLADTSLYADSSNSETTIGTVNDIDFLSNGFKLRNNTGFVNASQTYIYAAFAESPFKYALAR